MAAALQPVFAGAIALLLCVSPGLGAPTLEALCLIPRHLRRDRIPADPKGARRWRVEVTAWHMAWWFAVELFAVVAAAAYQRSGFTVQVAVAALTCSAISFCLLGAAEVRKVYMAAARKHARGGVDPVAFYQAMGLEEDALALMRDGQEYRSARLRAMEPDPEAKP